MALIDKETFDENKILIKFGKASEGWTVSDACKATAISGATGSGKTSASGMMLAKSFIKQGWGGRVLKAMKPIYG